MAHAFRGLQALLRLVKAVLRGHGAGSNMLRTIGVQSLVVLLNVATGVLTARLLGPYGRGIFSAITMWPQFIATVTAGGLPYALLYYGNNSDSAIARRAIGAALVLGVVIGIAGAVLGTASVSYVMREHYPNSAITFTQATMAVALINLLVILSGYALLARGRLAEFNTACWLDPALYLFLLLVSWTVTPLTPEVAALCLYSAGVLGLAWITRCLWRISPPSLRNLIDWLPRIASYAGRASGMGMLSSLTTYLDRLVLIFALSPRELGLYAVAFSLSRITNVVQNALGAVMLPAMAAASPADAKVMHDRSFRLVLLAMLLGAAATILLGKVAMVALYGAGFADAESILILLVGEAALGCLCQVVVQLFLALGRPGYSSWAQGASFVVTVIGLVLLVPHLGALGAALAMATGSGLRLAVLLGGIHFLLRLPLPRIPELGADIVALYRGTAR